MAVDLHVAQTGDGNPVVLLHGFPELAYSWRNQIRALADAGYRALAPDMRGYGESPAPAEVEAYDILELCDDVARVLETRGIERAAVVGHDWGATVAWQFALSFPERTACIAGLSVPLIPRAPAPPTAIMREHLGEDFYVVWFQDPGVADAALARDVRRTLLTTKVWTADWAAGTEDVSLPPWMTERDAQVYVDTFTRTGFTGGLNWYRNIDRNWQITAPYDDRKVEVPALFMAGSRDSTLTWMSPDVMQGRVTDLEVEIVDGAGHWIQQERPAEVNAALLRLFERAGW